MYQNISSFSLFIVDEDFEILANDVRNLKRSMSVKKVTFEEEDFLQFEAENYDKLTNNYDDRKKNSNTKTKNQKFRATTNENKGFDIVNKSVYQFYLHKMI